MTEPMTPEQIADLDRRFHAGETLYFSWIHHEVPIEVATLPISERVARINKKKPLHQRPLRNRALQPIQLDQLPPEVVAVWKALDDAWKVFRDGGGDREYLDACYAHESALASCGTLGIVQRLLPDIPCNEDGLIFDAESEPGATQ